MDAEKLTSASEKNSQRILLTASFDNTLPTASMKHLLCLLLCVCISKAQNAPVKHVTGKRVALVIGNNEYAPDDSKLRNCVPDARAVSRLLKEQLKFDTVLAEAQSENLNRLAFTRRIQAFQAEARGAAVALFYYAGHGMEDFDGRDNYLIPVDANLAEAAKDNAGLLAQGIPVDFVLKSMKEATTGAKIILLDCCRQRPKDRAAVAREGGGFVMPVDAAMPQDTLIMIAAAPARTASDGEAHGPFTNALLKYLPTPGTSLLRTFRAVRDEVSIATREQQRPWLKFDGSGDFFFDHALVEGEPTLIPPSPVPITETGPVLPGSGYFSLQQLFEASEYESHNEYSKRQILIKAQTLLNREGLYSGAPDGVPGRKTQQALIAWQRGHLARVSGRLDAGCLENMKLTGLPEEKQPKRPDNEDTPPRPDRILPLRSLGGGRYLSPYAPDKSPLSFPGYDSGVQVRCPHTGKTCRIP